MSARPSSHAHPSRGRASPLFARSAFTLIELLVVIGIIAVLIGILLPALNSARRHAERAKCASALRELGNAVQLYALDNKSAVPPAMARGYPYELNGVLYGAPSNIAGVQVTTAPLWLSFISKYLTKTRISVESVTGQGPGFADNWGCLAFQNYIYDTSGGYEHDQLGYGINYTPTYSQTNPPLGTDYPSDYGAPNYRHSLVETDGTKRWQSTVSGSWFKLSNYTRPAERAMFGDGEFWILEALAPPANGEIPPQKIHTREKTYSSGIAGQTMFDFYRHGKFPPVEVPGDAGYYRAQGGKVAYNVLYCDGHVVTSTDRRDAYRSIRMRFPQ